MRNVLLALGVCSAAAITPAFAQSVGDPPKPQDGRPPVVSQQMPPDAGRPDGHRFMRHMWDMRGGRPMRPELRLAARLSALETRIGITAEQLDAWRNYTNALQALMQPPRGLRPDIGQGGPAAGPGPAAKPAANKDPFAFQEKLADEASRRAAAADELKKAITALRGVLTPEQLKTLASVERRAGPPPARRGAPWRNASDWNDMPGPGGHRPFHMPPRHGWF